MMPSKYFPLDSAYDATYGSIYGVKFKDEIYQILRAILKDPQKMSNSKYSLTYNGQDSNAEHVEWLLYFNDPYKLKLISRIKLPCFGSTNPAALLVQMGTHTIEETWDGYRDFWYEDLEKQVAHLEKGNGP